MYTTSVAYDWDFLLVSPHKTAGCMSDSFHKVCVHHREVLSSPLTRYKCHLEEKEPPLIHSSTTFRLAFVLLLYWGSAESRVNANPSSAVGVHVWGGPEADWESPIFHSPWQTPQTRFYSHHTFLTSKSGQPFENKPYLFYNLINLFLNLKLPMK